MKKASLIKLLVAIGVTQANAEKIATLTPEEGTAVMEDKEIEPFAEAHKNHYKTLYENDPEILKKIDAQVFGRERDKFERKLKQTFGLTADEVKDKTTEEIIALAKTKATSTTDKTVLELQEELVAKENELKTLKETEIPKIRSEVDGHKKQFEINQKLSKKVSAFKLRNPLEDVLASIQTLNSVYDIDLDEKGELIYKVKGSNLLPKNTEGTKILTADDIIKGKLEAGKFLEESNGGKGGDGGNEDPIIVAGKKEEQKPDFTKVPGYNAAQEHLKAMKEKAAAEQK